MSLDTTRLITLEARLQLLLSRHADVAVAPTALGYFESTPTNPTLSVGHSQKCRRVIIRKLVESKDEEDATAATTTATTEVTTWDWEHGKSSSC